MAHRVCDSVLELVRDVWCAGGCGDEGVQLPAFYHDVLTIDGADHADLLKQLCPVLVQDLVLPSLTWRAGKVAALHRFIALQLLHATLGRFTLDTNATTTVPTCLFDAQLLAYDEGRLMTVLLSCLDDDRADTRTLSLHVTAALLQPQAAAHMTVAQWVALYPELLKRLDDAMDAIRCLAAKTLVRLLHAVSSHVIPTVYEGKEGPLVVSIDPVHFDGIADELKPHFDDPMEALQVNTCACRPFMYIDGKFRMKFVNAFDGFVPMQRKRQSRNFVCISHKYCNLGRNS